MATTTKDLQLNAETASAFLQKRYADLQILAAKLVNIVNTTHRPLPCKVVSDYNAAVKEYLDIGNQVFEQLGEHKIVVEQIVYRDGVPVKDPSDPNKVLTQAVISPLRPAIFVPGPECPNAVRLAGAAEAPLGIVPAVAAVAIEGLITVGVWAFRLGVAYLALEALKQIAIIVRVVSDREDPVAIANAFATCVDTAVKSGVSPASAAASCEKKTVPGAGMSLLAKIGLATVVAGAGVGVYYYLKKRKEKALAGADADDAEEDAEDEAADVLAGFDEDEDEDLEDVADDITAAVAEAEPEAASDIAYISPGKQLREADFDDVAGPGGRVTLDECPV